MDQAFKDSIVRFIKAYIEQRHRIAALERRVVELEAEQAARNVTDANREARWTLTRDLTGPWDYSRCEGSHPTSEPFFHN